MTSSSSAAPIAASGASDAPPPRLVARGLASSHGGPYELTLAAGECVAVVGRSGSGKSVLLRLLADLDPHEGEVWLDGQPARLWTGPQWRQQVVYQAAEPAWWAPTAAAHLHTPTPERLQHLLARLGLAAALLQSDITRLSTGERQRMALLRSLDRQPKVLLLDEPTAALDATTTLAVEALLAEHLQQGLALMVVTHSLEQAQRMGHRVLEVRDGGLHALPTTERSRT